MKEFSTKIEVTPIGQEAFLFFSDAFHFNPLTQENESGLVYNCNKSFTIEKSPAHIGKIFEQPIPCKVCLFTLENEIITIGTPDIPAFVTITPHLNTATLSVKCLMCTSPL